MDNFLCQHVNFPTRENNILDLFISFDPNMVINFQCVGKLCSSDHVLVLAELNFKTCGASFVDQLCCFCLVLLCFHARLFVNALWSTAGKGLASWFSFLISNCDVVTFPLVSCVRCGA